MAAEDMSTWSLPKPLKTAPQTAPQTAAAPSGLVDVSVQLQELIEVLKQNPPKPAQITNLPTNVDVFNQMAAPPTNLEKQELCRTQSTTSSSSFSASSAAALERNRLMEGLKVAVEDNTKMIKRQADTMQELVGCVLRMSKTIANIENKTDIPD